MPRKVYIPTDKPLNVKRASAGLGLYTEEALPANACILEYVGRVLSKEEEAASTGRYLFNIKRGLTIDGAARSNTARYINHSCKPNSEVMIHKDRIYIFTLRSLKAGEEITYDYGQEYYDEIIKPAGCKCASKKHKK